MHVLGICGSAAKTQRTLTLIKHVLAGAETYDENVSTELIDLATLKLDFCDGRPVEAYSQTTKDVLAKIREADAYVFGSPMYRGTMTGALKNLIDLISIDDIRGKVAGLVATGGSDHHYLGMELGFRTAMAFFQVHTIPGLLYFSKFTVENGRIVDEKVRVAAEQFGKDIVDLARGISGKALGPALF